MVNYKCERDEKSKRLTLKWWKAVRLFALSAIQEYLVFLQG